MPQPLAMPADDSLGLDEDQGRPPAPPSTRQQDPEHPISGTQMRLGRALQDSELLPQGDVLEHEVVVAATSRHDRAHDQHN